MLLRWASALGDAAEHLRAALTDEVFEHVARQIPSAWLPADRDFPGDGEQRAAYVDWLKARREALPIFSKEAERARALLV